MWYVRAMMTQKRTWLGLGLLLCCVVTTGCSRRLARLVVRKVQAWVRPARPAPAPPSPPPRVSVIDCNDEHAPDAVLSDWAMKFSMLRMSHEPSREAYAALDRAERVLLLGLQTCPADPAWWEAVLGAEATRGFLSNDLFPLEVGGERVHSGVDLARSAHRRFPEDPNIAYDWAKIENSTEEEGMRPHLSSAREAHRLDPDDRRTQLLLGQTLLRTGNAAEALTVMKVPQKDEQRYFDETERQVFSLWRATAQLATGDAKAALRAIEDKSLFGKEALEGDDGFVLRMAHPFLRGVTLLQLGRGKEAVRVLKKWLDQEPEVGITGPQDWVKDREAGDWLTCMGSVLQDKLRQQLRDGKWTAKEREVLRTVFAANLGMTDF